MKAKILFAVMMISATVTVIASHYPGSAKWIAGYIMIGATFLWDREVAYEDE